MKYSVIIPIYNAEKTLRRCLDSLLPQLNNDIEVLLINDGSTDNSAKICKEYVAKNSCFKYFDQENAGVSAARNLGIDNATGDYIAFIDSDDYVTQHMVIMMDHVLSEYNYDYVVFPIISTDGITETKESQVPSDAKFRDDLYPMVSDMITKKRINGPVSKIYKRDLLNCHQIRFPVGCSISEDRAFNIAYALHISSMKVSNSSFYFAVTSGEESLSRMIRSVEELAYHFSIEKTYLNQAYSTSGLEDKYLRQIKAADNFCACRQVYSRAKRMKLRGASKKEIMEGIRDDCKEMNAQNLEYPKTNFCRKIYLPVKMRLYKLIYVVSMRLAKSAS